MFSIYCDPVRWYHSDLGLWGGSGLQDVLRLEAEVKNLHAAVDQIQVTLASPDLNRLSLREQLTQRQVNALKSAEMHYLFSFFLTF